MAPWGLIAETWTYAHTSPSLPVAPPDGTGHHAVVRPRPRALLSKHKGETKGQTRDNAAAPWGQKSRPQEVTHGATRACNISETGSGAALPGPGRGGQLRGTVKSWKAGDVLGPGFSGGSGNPGRR